MSIPKPFTFDQIVALAGSHAELLEAMKDTLRLEELALAMLEDRDDPIRKAYISGCEAILKSWRAAIEKAGAR